MKRDIKHKIILLILASLVITACCKKEKCPKVPDDIKNAMPYKGGEKILFQNIDYENNRLDTVEVTVRYNEEKGNTPCSHPDNGGACYSFVNYKFGNRIIPNGTNNFIEINRMRPEWTYSWSALENKFAYNHVYSMIISELNSNGEKYLDVNVDSLSYDYYGYTNLEHKNVLYWTKNEGLILARQYKNDSLLVEMRKI